MMVRGFGVVLVLLALHASSTAQSVEIMPGTHNVFVDLQWLRTFDEARHWSLFSRTRATVDYQNSSDLLMGGYLNYTSSIGLGPTIVGAVGHSGAVAEAGVHYFSASPTLVFFGLASAATRDRFTYSWFSITRYTPALSELTRLYTSLEVYVQMQDTDLQVTVVRARTGLSLDSYQLGRGMNAAAFGFWSGAWALNPGIFLRKEY